MRAMGGSLRGAVGVVMCACLCATWIPRAQAAGVEALLACRKIAASPARLSCFDRESAALAAAMRTNAPAAPAPAHVTVTASAPSLSPQQTFGLAPMQVVERAEAAQRLPKQLDRLTAHIIALGRAADGREIFSLDNHQVWAQLVSDEAVTARTGDVATISRGWLGSYWLSLPSRQGCKVTRLR